MNKLQNPIEVSPQMWRLFSSDLVLSGLHDICNSHQVLKDYCLPETGRSGWVPQVMRWEIRSLEQVIDLAKGHLISGRWDFRTEVHESKTVAVNLSREFFFFFFFIKQLTVGNSLGSFLSVRPIHCLKSSVMHLTNQKSLLFLPRQC